MRRRAFNRGMTRGCSLLSGVLSQADRRSVYQGFAAATAGVLLCTDVGARGLDFTGVGATVQAGPVYSHLTTIKPRAFTRLACIFHNQSNVHTRVYHGGSFDSSVIYRSIQV